MLVPTKPDAPSGSDLAEIAGADVITQVGQLQAWLATLPGPLTWATTAMSMARGTAIHGL